MENEIKEIFRQALLPSTSKKDRQKMLSLFHQDDLEFNVKTELTENLNNTNVTDEEGKELNPLFEKLWRIISERGDSPRKKNYYLSYLLKIAAIIVFGLVIWRLALIEFRSSDQNYYTSIAPKGSISQIILSDSSTIFLNSGSTLKYRINNENRNREVFLEGEAWFQVEKSDKRPFIVHTDFYDINVKGTEFNVKAYKEDNTVVTTLEKGEIVITSEHLGLINQKLLKPGEQLIFNKTTASILVKNVNPVWFTSWKENKLIFINMSLGDHILLLERRFGVDIIVENPEVLKYHYDGTIKNESVIEILNLLEQTLPIDYFIRDQVIEIKRK